MIARQPESHLDEGQSIWVLFDIRIPSAVERLHRERATWQDQSDIRAIDKDHVILIVWPGGAQRLAA